MSFRSDIFVAAVTLAMAFALSGCCIFSRGKGTCIHAKPIIAEGVSGSPIEMQKGAFFEINFDI